MAKIIIIGLVVTIVGLFLMAGINNAMNGNGNFLNGQPTSQKIEEGDKRVVISGEVMHPGEYYISSDETLSSLLVLAGGVTTDADSLTYTESLIIGARTSFYIPKILDSSNMCIDVTLGKININKAFEDDLKSIGLTTSQAPSLIDHREQNGDFQAIEDIMEVKGIGNAAFEKVKDKITLR